MRRNALAGDRLWKCEPVGKKKRRGAPLMSEDRVGNPKLEGSDFAAVAAGHLEIYARVEFAGRD
jgi:hypothetical protein